MEPTTIAANLGAAAGGFEGAQVSWRCADQDEAGVVRFAQLLALLAQPGDVYRLEGDLGAGKTTFARAFIRAVAACPDLEVPSPTFPLVQRYETARFPLSHFDLYRLAQPEDAVEIGLADALGGDVTLVEWPERADEIVGTKGFIVRFTGSGPTRDVTVEGHGDIGARIERSRETHAFLDASGFGAVTVAYLQGDASPRRYGRLDDSGTRAILMDAPRRPDGPVIRDGLPYSQLAHLAEDVRPFVAIADGLRRRGVSTPEIFNSDLSHGLLIIEDFGDRVFGREIQSGADILSTYRPAVHLLAQLASEPAPKQLGFEPRFAKLAGAGPVALAEYDERALAIETELLVDWYVPFRSGAPCAVETFATFRAIWEPLFAEVVGHNNWVLRDFHSPNLVQLIDRSGAAGVGVLDFQDALRGHAAYDLVSLCQDARLDVSAGTEAALLAAYRDARDQLGHTVDWDAFSGAYAILGAQRATKILGIFARLAKRDRKPAYLVHMPRIWGYLQRNLSHPALGDLAVWYHRSVTPPDNCA